MSENHITPLRTYLTIAGTLFLLSGVTVWVSYFDFGSFNIIIAMGVASLKATLVALYFMHLLWDDKKNLTMFVMSLMFLAIFIIITLLDTNFRGGVNSETQYPIDRRADFYDDLPLTDTHGHPVDKHESDHQEGEKDHH